MLQEDVAVRVPIMVGALLAFAALGCGGGGGQPTGAPTAGPTGGAPTGAPTTAPNGGGEAVQCDAGTPGSPVAIADFAFSPSSLTVAVNSTVTWTNADSAPHTVTFDDGPDCKTLAGGASENVLFTVAGTYPYHCNIHSSMKGTVVVQ